MGTFEDKGVYYSDSDNDLLMVKKLSNGSLCMTSIETCNMCKIVIDKADIAEFISKVQKLAGIGPKSDGWIQDETGGWL